MTSLVSVENLTVTFPLGQRLFGAPPTLRAVKNVSLQIPKGSFFGLVGESGSGKTTLGRAILRATPIEDGKITYDDGSWTCNIADMTKAQERHFRSLTQMIFQDPYAALSPRMTVRDIIAEPLEVLGLTKTREETDMRVREIAGKCRLTSNTCGATPTLFLAGNDNGFPLLGHWQRGQNLWLQMSASPLWMCLSKLIFSTSSNSCNITLI